MLPDDIILYQNCRTNLTIFDKLQNNILHVYQYVIASFKFVFASLRR